MTDAAYLTAHPALTDAALTGLVLSEVRPNLVPQG